MRRDGADGRLHEAAPERVSVLVQRAGLLARVLAEDARDPLHLGIGGGVVRERQAINTRTLREQALRPYERCTPGRPVS